MESGQFTVANQDEGRRRLSVGTLPYLLSNALFFAYYYSCKSTSRLDWSPAVDELQAHFDRERRPIIYYAWHGDSWWSIYAAMSLPDALRPVGICNDGVLSRLNSTSGSWLGVDMFEFERHGDSSPRDQIIDFVRSRQRHVMVFPDAGGPYRQLKPGVLSIARDANADLVPIRLHVRPDVTIGRSMQHRIPLPFTRIECRWGAPLRADQASVESATQRLERLEVPVKETSPDHST